MLSFGTRSNADMTEIDYGYQSLFGVAVRCKSKVAIKRDNYALPRFWKLL